MNNYILNTVNQEFINNNLDSDVTQLVLQNNKLDNVSIQEIATQIVAKKKSQHKLPTWFKSQNIYYPNSLNIEQTSSESTAQYKSQLIKGKSIIDLTGGFGVDCYFFSNVMDSVTHCEINTDLSNIAKHNYLKLKKEHILCVNRDGIEYIEATDETYDWIYLDPSRRHNSKGKVFFLKDCLPNVPGNLDKLFKYSDNIMVKTSPLLDIKAGAKELGHVKHIHIVALNNDVKELLWILEKGYSGAITIDTINIKKDTTETFTFILDDELSAQASFSEPLAYLYEPNSAILKSGAFKSVSEKLKFHKLHSSSHLYTKNELIAFPGRRFKIVKKILYNKKLLKKELVYVKANVSTRNFPETVEQLKKKYHLRDGGTIYLFFTTDLNNQKIVLVCSKV